MAEEEAMISCAVVAHEERLTAATELAHTLGAVISLDDGSKGADANHLEAWRLTQLPDDEECVWSAVFEDDAQPVPDFLAQAESALAVAPEPVVSFYLGTGRPPRWQERIPGALATADRSKACWLTATHAKHAVALAIHTDLREDWCVTRRHRVAYCNPSLVDHADWPTLIQHRDEKPRDIPRRAWRTGTRDRWNSKTVAL
jgi:hypothetical protein